MQTQTKTTQVEIARGWPYFAALFLLIFVAFWPTYFAPGLSASSIYVHLHAATAAAWAALLIIQPWLIRTYRYDLHRRLGAVSYVLVPILLAAMILLASYRLRNISESDFVFQSYVFYLQFFLTILFALFFAFAILYRKRAELHARFMIGTGLTLIDPVFARLFYTIHPASGEYHQWLTFGLTDAVLMILILLDRRSRERWIFPAMLAVFVFAQIPALLWLTQGTLWQWISRWFQALPLT